MAKARVLGALGILAVCAAIPAMAGASASAQTSTAPDAPGAMSYFDLARKDCVGTARNTSSKVWFTVADGVLSDTYWPTIDATNVHTLQYLVTDGHSFTDVQTDASQMTYRVLPDPTGMSCTVLATSTAHHYQILTTYIADPARDAVLMRTTFYGPRSDQLYVRLDPLAGGTGGGALPPANPPNPEPENAGGNSAELVNVGRQTVPVDFNLNTTTNAVNRNYAVPTYMALESSSGFSSASVGYAGTASDGLTMLDSAHALSPYDSAPDGHVTLTAEIPSRSFTLALGFGTTEKQALGVAGDSVDQNFGRVWARYGAGWRGYDAGLRKPARRLGAAAIREYYESVNVVKASEDKTFPGAIAAGLASPWGQSVPAGEFSGTPPEPTYFGSYREEFSRDTYEAFTGLLVAGDVQTAQAATKFLFEKQQLPNGSMPRNSLPNGESAPDTGGLQLDETSYPILMDWQSGLAGDHNLYENHVIPAADFLVANGPSDGVERWEEQSGYSPSTIAAEIAGLTAAAAIAQVNHDPTHAAIYQATADDFARNVKNWTVTTNGPYAPAYFIRVSKTGLPNATISYALNNGNSTQEPQQNIVDAGFLDLVRLGVLPASDPDVQASVKVIDDVIERQTPSGPGFYRYGFANSGNYSEDGYGDCYDPAPPPQTTGQDPTNCFPSGKPWPGAVPGTNPPVTDTGTGHLWPVLSGERGEYEIAAGDFHFARQLLRSMRKMTSGQGLEPEQVWEDPDLAASPFGSDPTTASIGFVDGQPAGSASPLTWAQAQYARLALDLSAGRDLETPQIVSDRYVRNGMPTALPITVTSPANGVHIDSSTQTVTGTTTPGAAVVAEASPPTGAPVPIASTTAQSPSGNWTLTLPVSFGTTTITVTATLGRSTAYTQLSVINVALPGTNLLTVTNPDPNDNGPGTYQYPTGLGFPPGTFELSKMQVNQTGSYVYIQLTIANLTNIFGNSFGAQLLDLYVHNPAATTTTTTTPSAFNYGIAPADAWSERLEGQGFASLVWEDASGDALAGGQLVVDDSSGTATLILPQATFGTVGSDWVFTVALTGQDGFSPDSARQFTPTAGANTFGVCAPGGTAQICSYNANLVPKVMSTIPPSNVSQDTELDPTLGPVELQGVTVP